MYIDLEWIALSQPYNDGHCSLWFMNDNIFMDNANLAIVGFD